MIACLFYEVMQPRALSPKHKNAINLEIKLRIIRLSALIKSKHPDMSLLHLLQRTDQVCNPRNPNMLRGSSRCFGYGRGNRS